MKACMLQLSLLSLNCVCGSPVVKKAKKESEPPYPGLVQLWSRPLRKALTPFTKTLQPASDAWRLWP